MKQIDLVDYLLLYGCETVRISATGYYVMRNIKTGKMSGVPLPKKGENLRAVTICHICKNLDAPIPDCAKGASEFTEQIRSKHKNK